MVKNDLKFKGWHFFILLPRLLLSIFIYHIYQFRLHQKRDHYTHTYTHLKSETDICGVRKFRKIEPNQLQKPKTDSFYFLLFKNLMSWIVLVTRSFWVFSSCALSESTSVSSRSTSIPSPPPLADAEVVRAGLELETELALELLISSRSRCLDPTSSVSSILVEKLLDLWHGDVGLKENNFGSTQDLNSKTLTVKIKIWPKYLHVELEYINNV